MLNRLRAFYGQVSPAEFLFAIALAGFLVLMAVWS